MLTLYTDRRRIATYIMCQSAKRTSLTSISLRQDESDNDSEDDYANESDTHADEYFKTRAALGIEVICL